MYDLPLTRARVKSFTRPMGEGMGTFSTVY
jgi:hypothetical protein